MVLLQSLSKWYDFVPPASTSRRARRARRARPGSLAIPGSLASLTACVRRACGHAPQLHPLNRSGGSHHRLHPWLSQSTRVGIWESACHISYTSDQTYIKLDVRLNKRRLDGRLQGSWTKALEVAELAIARNKSTPRVHPMPHLLGRRLAQGFGGQAKLTIRCHRPPAPRPAAFPDAR